MPKPVAYTLTWSFGHERHQPQFFTSNICRYGYICICGQHSLTVCSHWCSYRKWWVIYLCSMLCTSIFNTIHTLMLCWRSVTKTHLTIKHTSALWLSPWPLSIRFTGSDSISWKCEPTVTEIAGSVSLDVSSTGYTSIFRALWLITNICAIAMSWNKQLSNCTITRRIYEMYYVYK